MSSRDQVRRLRARHQDGADDEVGLQHEPLDREARRRDASGCVRARSGRRSAAARRSCRRSSTSASMPAAIQAAFVPGHAGAEDQDARRRDAGRAAHQHAAPAVRPLEVGRADVRRHAAGDLAHRRQQRQPSVGCLHGLVRDRGDLALGQEAREGLVGGQVQVREQELPGAEALVLLAAAAPSPSRSCRPARRRRPHPAAISAPAAVNCPSGSAEPSPAVLWTTTRWPAATSSRHALGRGGHAVLVVLDFLRDADDHARALPLAVAPGSLPCSGAPRMRRARPIYGSARPGGQQEPRTRSSRRGPGRPARPPPAARTAGAPASMPSSGGAAGSGRARATNRCTYSSVKPGRAVVAAQELDGVVSVARSPRTTRGAAHVSASSPSTSRMPAGISVSTWRIAGRNCRTSRTSPAGRTGSTRGGAAVAGDLLGPERRPSLHVDRTERPANAVVTESAARRQCARSAADGHATARPACARRERLRGADELAEQRVRAGGPRLWSSGWNCEATKNGWSGSSMISTSRPLLATCPENTSPCACSASWYAGLTSQRWRCRSSRRPRRRPRRPACPARGGTAARPAAWWRPGRSRSSARAAGRSPACGVAGSNSLELAPSSPHTLRANSMTAHCRPRQMPEERDAVLARVPDRRDLALDAAARRTRPGSGCRPRRRGRPRVADPPRSSDATQRICTSAPWRNPPCFSASITLRYASRRFTYLPTTAIVTGSTARVDALDERLPLGQVGLGVDAAGGARARRRGPRVAAPAGPRRSRRRRRR